MTDKEKLEKLKKYNKSKTIYVALDGKEFSNKVIWQDYQYSLIDWSTILNHNIFWVSVRLEDDKPTVKEVIPFAGLEPHQLSNYFWKYHLYIPDDVSLNLLKEISQYLTDEDEHIINSLSIGLNFIVGDNEKFERTTSYNVQLSLLYKSLNDIQSQIDNIEGLMKQIISYKFDVKR